MQLFIVYLLYCLFILVGKVSREGQGSYEYLMQQDAVGAYTWASLYLTDILECIYLGNLHASQARV